MISARDLSGMRDIPSFRRLYRHGDPWPGLFDGLPADLAALARDKAFDPQNTSFCIWRRADGRGWERGPVRFSSGEDPDGSAELLRHLDGRPESYSEFAAEYYEVDVQLTDVAAIYRHEPLTEHLVRRLNADMSLSDLEADVKEIGYPERG